MNINSLFFIFYQQVVYILHDCYLSQCNAAFNPLNSGSLTH